MLGLEITYLVISYFMGKKMSFVFALLKMKASRQDAVDQFSPSVSGGRRLSLFLHESCTCIWARLNLSAKACRADPRSPANRAAPSYCCWLVTLTALCSSLWTGTDCSLRLSLALRSPYIQIGIRFLVPFRTLSDKCVFSDSNGRANALSFNTLILCEL